MPVSSSYVGPTLLGGWELRLRGVGRVWSDPRSDRAVAFYVSECLPFRSLLS